MDTKNNHLPNIPELPQLPTQANPIALASRAQGAKKYFTETMPLPDFVARTDKVYGKQIIERLWSILIGGGDTVFGGDISGIWSGAKRWADAPFRVDMLGNIFASSITILGGTISGVTISEYLARAGGTMLGFLTLVSDPTAALHAATKQYVDNKQIATFQGIVVANDEVITNNGEVVYNI